MLDSERTFKIKGKLRRTKGYVKRNFACVSNYLHLKSLAWKWYCPTSPNYKRHEFDQGQSRKLLQSSTNYIQTENTKTTRPLFKGSWVLLYFWHSNWDYFGYTSKNTSKNTSKTTLVKRYFHTLIFTIWQVKDYKEVNNFILRTNFWKCLVPIPKCPKKSTIKTKLFNSKSYIKKSNSRL